MLDFARLTKPKQVTVVVVVLSRVTLFNISILSPFPIRCVTLLNKNDITNNCTTSKKSSWASNNEIQSWKNITRYSICLEDPQLLVLIEDECSTVHFPWILYRLELSLLGGDAALKNLGSTPYLITFV